MAEGFELRFTAPVDPARVANVAVQAHTYRYHKDYGSPKVDERTVAVTASELDETGTSLRIRLAELRAGYLHTIALDGVRSRAGQPLLGDRVYYTLLQTP